MCKMKLMKNVFVYMQYILIRSRTVRVNLPKYVFIPCYVHIDQKLNLSHHSCITAQTIE